MKSVSFFGALIVAATASGQTIGHVYNRDNYDDFKLKSVTTTSTVFGAVVRNRTVFVFDNPYKKLTEASVNFSLNPGAALGGFAYWYKDEYVKGILMDKRKAWFIYTAITSRNRDPGILDQVTPSSYHAQIYPLAVGYELRVELTAVDYVVRSKDDWLLPGAIVNEGIPFKHFVNTANPYVQLMTENGDYKVHKAGNGLQVLTTAQKWKDGRIYVAGVSSGADPVIVGLHDVYQVTDSVGRGAFVGWTKSARSFTVSAADDNVRVPVNVVTKGDEAAKLWAHQRLIHADWRSRDDVMKLSMKYQVPSKFTALLAVPQEEMKLFRQKAKEFEKKQREGARRQREWQRKNKLNYNRSSGGDPEIRVAFDGCQRAYALLPGGRIINLMQTGDGYWGGNFDIPADAPEGEYVIRVFGMKHDGKVIEKSISYTVDRTPPTGTAIVKPGLGRNVIAVRSEAGLARVFAYSSNGILLEFIELLPGLYVCGAPTTLHGEIAITLLDKAHNRGELRCSLP